MDALAGYGSDDSGASSSPSSNHSKAVAPQPPNSGLAGLLGDISDASSDNDSLQHHQRQRQQQQPALSDEPPRSKKPKLKIASAQFPVPTLATTTDKDSWIYWNTNYLQLPVQHPTITTKIPTAHELQHHLDQLRQYSTSSWADALRSQQEFHNPHFFMSVVEHFGISEPLGSCLGNKQRSGSLLQDLEQRLFPLTNSTSTELEE